LSINKANIETTNKLPGICIQAEILENARILMTIRLLAKITVEVLEFRQALIATTIFTTIGQIRRCTSGIFKKTIRLIARIVIITTEPPHPRLRSERNNMPTIAPIPKVTKAYIIPIIINVKIFIPEP